MQVIAALQGQDRAFTFDTALGLHRLVVPIRCAPVAPGFIVRKGLGGLGISRRRGHFVAVAQGQLGTHPPGQAGVGSLLHKRLGTGVIAVLVTHRRQTVGVVQVVPGAGLQQFEQPFLARGFFTVPPADAAEQVGGDQSLHCLSLEQLAQALIRLGTQTTGQLQQRAVAHRGALQVLDRIQAYGTVPIVSGVGHPGFFAKAGDAQFQWIAEAGNAQLAGLAKRCSRLVLQNHRVAAAGLGAHGEQGPPQRVRGPGAAQPTLVGR
ncbi:hypothetical protein D3C76_1065930 [compost metagenome]